MRATSTERSPRGLFAELLHDGLTVTTPEREEVDDGGRFDLVTVIQIDGTVITHVSRDLVGAGDLRALFAEHMGRVNGALAPLRRLRRDLERIRRWLVVCGALVSAGGLGASKLLDINSWMAEHFGIGTVAQLSLLGIGSVVGATGIAYFRVQVGAWLRRLSVRILLWLVRRGATRVTSSV